MTIYVDPCPTCGEANSLRWIDSTRTTDRWECNECGCTWVIDFELPTQTDTELVERVEING